MGRRSRSKQRGVRRRPKLFRTERSQGPRSCGTCDLCIRLGLSGLKVPPGCGCLWQRGLWGSDLSARPDRTNVVPMLLDDTDPGGPILLRLKRSDPKAARRGIVRRLVRMAEARGRAVLVKTGAD